jgi:FMN phosphatase YigB (HAD superfamily)
MNNEHLDSEKPEGSDGRSTCVKEEDKQLMNCKAVAFDLFGTLVKRTIKNDCYRKLFTLLNIDLATGAQTAMTLNIGLSELAEHLKPGHGHDLVGLEEELNNDLDGIRLLEGRDTLETLKALHRKGIPLALVSNLAQPYAARALKLLETNFKGNFTSLVFSCEVGLLKPDPRIFQLVSHTLAFPLEDILMVGNNLRDDVAGADAVGMPVLFLDRDGVTGYGPRTINTLLQVLQYFDPVTCWMERMPKVSTPHEQIKRPILLFMDTEFTDLDSLALPELISIGLVAEDGQTFYAELSGNWEEDDCSYFTKAEVLPLLEGGAFSMPRQTVRQRIISWIDALPRQVRIVVDSHYDWELMVELLSNTRPTNLHPKCSIFLHHISSRMIKNSGLK